ncbi:hypothetical protein BN946_scf184845.g18 [Trametes cinnabarina]|uniref:Transmembrane protein n=1 Tax=Pycnoporus cinnabarinus TaxID=5643 RepID=A0A060SFH2_PYCCI|nr:hypothetical protein BN946_scf184845.g18 [Trametes cinnabarina]
MTMNSSSQTAQASLSSAAAISPAGTGTMDNSGTGRNRAGVIAGGVIAGIAALVALVVLGICVNAALVRQTRVQRPKPAVTRQPETWLGLPAASDSPRADSVSIGSTNEKTPFSPSEVPHEEPQLPLQPNRRKPSVYAIDTAALPPARTKIQTHALTVPQVEAAEARGDSPTLPASPYATRKPVPSLSQPEAPSRSKSSGRSTLESGVYEPSLASAVPSTATSRMYRTRDSGWSTESRFYRELGNARASSVIDPHLAGALKPMQNALVPDVPPLPQDCTRQPF